MLDFPELEKKILKFWQENKIFEKLRKKNQGKPRWSFLDGPITANNPMGVHHAWGRTYKDLFQRYKAMQGFDQRYQNGFDCQGLWVEVEVEKELGFKTKKDIEKYGIDKFVEKCKERVKKYAKIQTDQSIRLGQWMDWDNSYYTMSDKNNYAIWGFLKKCHEKGYLYKGKDSVPWCPRCGTAISQHEILTEEYKEITHRAIYFKLKLTKPPAFVKTSAGKPKNTYFLVWTTTPWTLPGNVALAVNPDFEYGVFDNKKECLILLKELAPKILGKEYKLKQKIKGKDLVGLKYEGPFDNLPRVKEAAYKTQSTHFNKMSARSSTQRVECSGFHTVVGAKDLVTAEEGTGIVHTATGAGTEDFRLGKEKGLPVIDVIDESAVYLEGLGEFSGKNAKKNPEIILDYVKELDNGKFFYKIEDYKHRYPTCWRCKEELVWRAVDEWYIAMEKLRKPLMEAAKIINWIPDFGLERELDWLKNMEDWLISKKRYWGLALPIFECQKCHNFEVLGSKEELKERAIEGLDDFKTHSPHRPWVDKVKIKCSKCGTIVSRIPDVGNPWLDAGIVPFSTLIDPKTKKVSYYSDKKYWKDWFPIELVAESFPGQFKNWFYAILTMSVVLENKAPVKTIFGYALVRDEKGEEMHKSKGNAIWFDDAVEKIGAEPMRWLYARQNPANNLNFGYSPTEEIKKKLLTLYNSFVFFKTYVSPKEMAENSSLPKRDNVLDKWIISKLNNLILKTTKGFDEYNPGAAVLAIENFFIEDLSLWYIRRSRRRFRPEEKGRKETIETLYYCLLNIIKLISPVLPFFTEEIYQGLKTSDMPESVHLCDWPKIDKKKIDKTLEEKMREVRNIVTLALAERAAKGIKVRQPLAELRIKDKKLRDEKELMELIKEEVNVKEIVFDSKTKKDVELDIKITKELEEEGIYRDMIRNIKDLRKELGLTKDDLIPRVVSSAPAPRVEDILKEAGAKEFKVAIDISKEDIDAKKEIKIKGQKHYIGIKK